MGIKISFRIQVKIYVYLEKAALVGSPLRLVASLALGNWLGFQ